MGLPWRSCNSCCYEGGRQGGKGGGVWCGFSSSPSVVWCGFSYAFSTSKSATCGSTLGYLKLPGWCNVVYLLIFVCAVIICVYDYANIINFAGKFGGV